MLSAPTELKRNIRNSNLELLRIVSMFLIVMSHSDDWMGLSAMYRNTICANRFIADWLNLGGQIGVGCFLLISGYFMVEQQFNFKRLLRLLGEVWFYSISAWTVYIIVKAITGTLNTSSPSSLSSLLIYSILSFFPVLSSHYWFVTAYVILMILSPFFNKLIYAMDKRTYQILLIALIVIFFLLNGTFPKILPGISEGNIIPVFVMYFIAGYIKKYVNNNINNSNKHMLIAVIGYIFLYATCIGISIIGNILDSKTIMDYCYVWKPLKSPIILIINIELFLAFLRMKKRQSKLINAIASNTFGVYLLHANTIICGFVLPVVVPVYKETNPLKVLPYSICAVIFVYISCTIIDMIRQKTVEKLWIKLLNKKYDICEEKFKHLIRNAVNKIFSVGKWYYK